jgi:hypothetical protein
MLKLPISPPSGLIAAPRWREILAGPSEAM